MLSARWRHVSNCLPPGTRLLAVSKGQPASLIRSLADLGQIDFGESRLQEALPKLDVLKEIQGLRWHFIGRLQANKVRGVIKHFEFIHSVDSFGLAERISRIAGEENKSPSIMLQVKFCEDPTKGGFSPDQLLADWSQLIELPHLQLVGLMTMAPIRLNLEERRILFRNCREFADQLHLSECSMGMSSDWQEAVQAGSTWLRLGSALFGKPFNTVNSHTDITKNN